jgi:hypothetical protein
VPIRTAEDGRWTAETGTPRFREEDIPMPKTTTFAERRAARDRAIAQARRLVRSGQETLTKVSAALDQAAAANRSAAERPNDPTREESARKAFFDATFDSAETIATLDEVAAKLDEIAAD